MTKKQTVTYIFGQFQKKKLDCAKNLTYEKDTGKGPER